MNAFTIYLVLQMDSIKTMLFLLTIITFGWLVLTLLAAAQNRAIYKDYPSVSAQEKVKSEDGFRKVKLLACLFVPLLLLTAFLPNTRTMAAMLILPSIVNNETVQKEAGELYELAKEALRNAGEKK